MACRRTDEVSLIQDVVRVHKASPFPSIDIPDSGALAAGLQTKADPILEQDVVFPSIDVPDIKALVASLQTKADPILEQEVVLPSIDVPDIKALAASLQTPILEQEAEPTGERRARKRKRRGKKAAAARRGKKAAAAPAPAPANDFILTLVKSTIKKGFDALRPKIEPLLQPVGIEWDFVVSVIDTELASIDDVNELKSIASDPMEFLLGLGRSTASTMLQNKTEPLLADVGLVWGDVAPIVEKELASLDMEKLQAIIADPGVLVADLRALATDLKPVVNKAMEFKAGPYLADFGLAWGDVAPILYAQLSAQLNGTDSLEAKVQNITAAPGVWLVDFAMPWKPVLIQGLLYKLKPKAEPLLASVSLTWGDVEPILKTQLESFDIDPLYFQGITPDPQAWLDSKVQKITSGGYPRAWLANLTAAWKPVVVKATVNALQPIAEPLLAGHNMTWTNVSARLEEELGSISSVDDALSKVSALTDNGHVILSNLDMYLKTFAQVLTASAPWATSLAQEISTVVVTNRPFEDGLEGSLVPQAAMPAMRLRPAVAA